jgi:hypothetical protein
LQEAVQQRGHNHQLNTKTTPVVTGHSITESGKPKVTKEATSNIIGMNVIRAYNLKMDLLTTGVTALLDNVASLQNK